MEETWQDVPFYEKHYQASTLGNIRSIKNGKIKIIKSSKSTSGYLSVNFWKNNKMKTIFVHKIMAITFLGHTPNKFEGKVIDHINRDKLDNKLCNLRLITQRQNSIKKVPKSGFHGVYLNSLCNKWQVRLRIGKIKVHFSYFECPLLAHYCYLEFSSLIDNDTHKYSSREELIGHIRKIRNELIENTKIKYFKQLELYKYSNELN